MLNIVVYREFVKDIFGGVYVIVQMSKDKIVINIIVNFISGEDGVSLMVFGLVFNFIDNIMLIVVYYCISVFFVLEYCRIEVCEDSFIVEKVFKVNWLFFFLCYIMENFSGDVVIESSLVFFVSLRKKYVVNFILFIIIKF